VKTELTEHTSYAAYYILIRSIRSYTNYCETVSIRSYGSRNERDNWFRHLVGVEANILLQGSLSSHADLVEC